MRIVVKVGTNLLTDKSGILDGSRVKVLAQELTRIKNAGHQVVLVTSGAIGSGMGKIGFSSKPVSLRQKQALAAIGQPLLMEAYEHNFSSLGVAIAQVLLTRQDFYDREKYINARSTMLTLLDFGVIPVVNENDTVAVEEINFGGNDILAALVAVKVCADWLFLCTDVDGLYKGIPGKSELISTVNEITPEIEGYASGVSGSGKGVGGMAAKLMAAKIVMSAGVKMVILNGARSGLIEKVINGDNIGTIFLAKGSLEPRKCWIAFGAKCRGKILIDSGAANVLLHKGKSLLPSGIIGVEGNFSFGDTVSVLGPDKKEIGKGLTYYSSDDIKKIKGKKTGEISKILLNADYEEVIHRDNLVILT